MRALNAGHAQGFSKAHNRSGYLLQDRDKSVVTQDQGYVEQLVRYVHANPLRVGVICVSLAVRQGESLWTSPDFAKVQMALRPCVTKLYN
jgi:hypothetical protein